MSKRELRDRTGWPMATLRYELAFQSSASDGDTMGPGRCGHNARGSGFCAGCVKAEIDRRTTEASRDERPKRQDCHVKAAR